MPKILAGRVMSQLVVKTVSIGVVVVAPTNLGSARWKAPAVIRLITLNLLVCTCLPTMNLSA